MDRYITRKKKGDVIPSPINHYTLLFKFRLQNFASASPYPDKARLPSRFSLEI